jgi:hypothetical protein
MKAILIFLIFKFYIISQSDNVIGDYTLKLETIDNNLLDYKLTLSRDSTFNFHYYSNIKNGIPPEINKYGKENGLWKTM